MSSITIIFPGESWPVDPASPGLAHGFGLFETIRLREGRIELWEAHWQRLTRSAAALGLACPFDRDEVLAAVARLTPKLPAEAIVKLSLLREHAGSRLLVYSRPVHEPPEGIGLCVDATSPLNEKSPLAGHKTHNYLENLLALEASRQRGCFEGLRLNSQGHLAEGAIANIFFHRDGDWYTPCLNCGPLPGVVREQLLQALPVEEGVFAVSDLLEAEAVFLTNASFGLLPVDWLLSGDEKIRLSSRDHPSFKEGQDRLRRRIDNSAIRI